MTTEDFIDRARAKHGDRFDYASSRYLGFKQPIKVICRKHGPCTTTPKSHLYSESGGCAECRTDLVKVATSMTTPDFVARARKIHGDRYDYHLVDCFGTHSHVVIICPQHGPFRMRPSRHLSGRGCAKCAFEAIGRERKLSFWDFVERVAAVHGAGRYEYELKDFVNAHSKIPIHCPKHGVFRQTLASHMKGRGCPKCAESNGEQRIREVLTLLDVEFLEQARFPECRDRGLLRFDFYVPSHRLLIEFDGRQHYENSELWGGQEKLDETKRRDAIKNRFAERKGYRLLRIPFYDYDNIDTILLEQLSADVTYARGDDHYVTSDLCSAG